MMLSTTSKPFFSPRVYFQCHIPSLSLFQYAPDAECIPLLPIDAAVGPEPPPPVSLPGVDCEWDGVTCWIIVQVTANL